MKANQKMDSRGGGGLPGMSLDRWADGGAGDQFGGGVAAAFFLLLTVSVLLFLFVSFAPSVNNVLLSLQRLRGDAGGGGLGEWLGRWSAFLPLLLCVFLQLCSPLFLFLPSASHGAVVDWEGNGSWR